MNRRAAALFGIDLGRAPVPDESTILGFRHLLEKHELGWGDAERREPVSGKAGHPHHHENDCGRDHYSCALVDQEPEWRARSGYVSDRKGKQWYFGLKAHIGVTSSKAMCIRCARRRLR